MRSSLSDFLGKHDAAFGEVFPRQFFHSLGGPFDQIGEADAKFDHSFVVAVIEGLGNHTAFIQHGPELVAAPGVIMTDAHRRLARIAANNDEFHAFSQVVGKCAHWAGVEDLRRSV